MSLWICKSFRLLPQLATVIQKEGCVAASRRFCQLIPLVLALTLVLAGCGSGSKSSSDPVGLQTPPAAGSFNSYIGTSPLDPSSSPIGSSGSGNAYGIWAATVDHSTSLFTAWDTTTNGNNTDFYTSKVNGTFSMSGGFLDLTQTNDPLNNPPPAGFAFEIPGRVAILRQGDTTIPVTAMVPGGCPEISGKVQFNFVVLPTPAWARGTDAAYGSLTVETSGTAWNLGDYHLSTLAGAAARNSGISFPTGTCAASAAGTSVFVPTDASMPLPKTIAVGPSGFYIADQGLTASGVGNPGQFGVLEPSAQVTTSEVLAHKYLGFIYEAGADASGTIPESQMAAFGASAPAGKLVGGGFANDDLSQSAATNLVIDLGTQDSKTNGLFPNVVITNQATGTTYPAVAVVGNPENKFAIFIIGEDTDYSLPIGIYLFQQ